MRFVLSFIAFFLFLFSNAQEKVIHLKYENGNPHVIYYYEPFFLKKTVVKQEIYFSNGKLDHSGELKHGKEHGEWIYYYENGNKKAHEYWSMGRETGTWKEYNEQGKLVKSIEYKSGKVIKTTDY